MLTNGYRVSRGLIVHEGAAVCARYSAITWVVGVDVFFAEFRAFSHFVDFIMWQCGIVT